MKKNTKKTTEVTEVKTSEVDAGAIAREVFKGIGKAAGVACLVGVAAIVICGWLFWQLIKFIIVASAVS